jgi:1-acyl-sn-glycerol-3-phosphate acyltransferase
LFYIKVCLISLWSIFACSFGFVYALLHWGNLSINHKVGGILSWGVLKILGIKVELQGAEYLTSSQPCVYVANHQSGLDIATFGAMYPTRTIIIGKKQLIWIPFLGLYFRASGNISIDREKRLKAYAGLKMAAEIMKKIGASIWIFPEGTRNIAKEGLLPFKRGAFHIAIQAKVPIVPVVSSSLLPIIDRKKKYINSGVVKIVVLPPIQTEGYTEAQIDELSNKVRNQMLEALRGLSDSSSLI